MKKDLDKKQFKAIVVDDEPLARRLLIASLKKYVDIDVIAECENGRQAVSAIDKLKPDLMFLDIQMPGLGGFDVIRSVNPELMPELIFVTAFDAYAIDAFDANAVDYLLKPISEERLDRAVTRALIHLTQGEYENIRKRELYTAVNKIAERVRDKSKLEEGGIAVADEERKFTIKDGDSVMLIREAEIDWIDAAGDYMCIHVDGETHVIRSTMRELLTRLDQDRFKRVHRSTIVNTDRIIKIQRHTKGEYILHLDCDEEVKVSRHYKAVIKEFIDQQP